MEWGASGEERYCSHCRTKCEPTLNCKEIQKTDTKWREPNVREGDDRENEERRGNKIGVYIHGSARENIAYAAK